MNTPSIPAAIAPFWAAFEAARGAHVTSRFYEATHFDDNESGANHLATLVFAGKKRATAGLAWSFDGAKGPPSKAGDLSVVDARDRRVPEDSRRMEDRRVSPRSERALARAPVADIELDDVDGRAARSERIDCRRLRLDRSVS